MLKAVFILVLLVLAAAKTPDVVKLTDANFDQFVIQSDVNWIIDFYHPGCGHCKTLAPEYKKAAAKHLPNIKFGAVDCSKNSVVSSRYSISGYPTIKIFNGSPTLYTYKGARTATAMVDYITEKKLNVLPLQLMVLDNNQKFRETGLTTSMVYIAILPKLGDSSEEIRAKYLTALKNVARKHSNEQFSFWWTEAYAQQALEDAFSVAPGNHPVLLALSPKKMMYMRMKGALTEARITEFVQNILAHKEPAVAISSIPDLVDVTNTATTEL